MLERVGFLPVRGPEWVRGIGTGAFAIGDPMKVMTEVVVLCLVMLSVTSSASDPSFLVVEIHESKKSGNLWSHVGIVDPLNKTVEWGKSQKYDKGHLPVVSVDGLNVVEVHQGLEKQDLLSSFASGDRVMKAPRLFYHVGVVNLETKTISWGESHKYGKGRWPSVALEGQLVAEVHQAKDGEFLWYHVGNIDLANKIIEWGPSTQYDRGWFPAIDTDGSFAVEAHRSLRKRNKWTDEEEPTRLFCHVGMLNADTRSISWSESQKYDEKGKFPNIAVSGQLVVEAHQSHKENALWYHVGVIDVADRIITWGDSRKYDLGRMPTLDFQDRTVVEVHQSRKSDKLWYHVGTVDEQTKTISWGESYKYDKGFYPNISVTRLAR